MTPARPRLLDLCCGAGGASAGYDRAGFEVVGVDKDNQPHYPFEFHRDDALEVLADRGFVAGFDAVHASFPCQGFTAYRRRGGGVGDGYPDLITPGRPLLEASGLPWVMENVERSPVRPVVHLCGSSFGLDVQRHRWFETNVPMMSPPCVHGIWKPRFPCAETIGCLFGRRFDAYPGMREDVGLGHLIDAALEHERDKERLHAAQMRSEREPDGPLAGNDGPYVNDAIGDQT